MSILMATPQRYQDESMLGYRCRVALENGFASWPAFMRAFLSEAIDSGHLKKGSLLPSTRELLGIELADPTPANDLFRLYRYRRVCPMCLEEAVYHRQSWSIALLPHCNVHRFRLVDRCPACGKSLQHICSATNLCSCGYDLRYWRSEMLSELCGLERIIHAMAANQSFDAASCPPLHYLSLGTIQRLSLLVGSYAAYPSLSKPRKVAIRSDVCVAARVLEAANIVMTDWPKGLDALIEKTIDADEHHIQQHFGYLYRAIYRDLREAEFDFLRDALDDYIQRRWDGLVTSKNRWQSENLRQNPRYLSSKRTQQLTRVSRKKCRAWVTQGKVDGLVRPIACGRRQVLIVANQLSVVRELADNLNLSDAASILGLPKRRLRELLLAGVIDGHHDQRGCAWQIDEASPRVFVQQLQRVAIYKPSSGDCQSLESVLRHSMTADFTFVDFIRACLEGVIRCYAAPNLKLLDLKICKNSFDSWLATRSSGISVPEVAEYLNIKQEVAYHLVKKGLIHSQTGGRTGSRVTVADIATFQRDFCLARDLALAWGVSPRTLIADLQKKNIVPVTGRDIDGCRQYVFLREDVEKCGYPAG